MFGVIILSNLPPHWSESVTNGQGKFPFIMGWVSSCVSANLTKEDPFDCTLHRARHSHNNTGLVKYHLMNLLKDDVSLDDMDVLSALPSFGQS